MDLFSQPPLEFPHSRENNSHSEEIYIEQMERLNNNSKVILKCLLEGQRLSGIDCNTGIKSKDMDAPIRMSEYRKRFQEIIKAGYPVETEKGVNGCKTWFIITTT